MLEIRVVVVSLAIKTGFLEPPSTGIGINCSNLQSYPSRTLQSPMYPKEDVPISNLPILGNQDALDGSTINLANARFPTPFGQSLSFRPTTTEIGENLASHVPPD